MSSGLLTDADKRARCTREEVVASRCVARCIHGAGLPRSFATASGFSWEHRGRPSSKVERRRNGTRSRIAVPEQLGRARASARACMCSTRHAYPSIRERHYSLRLSYRTLFASPSTIVGMEAYICTLWLSKASHIL